MTFVPSINSTTSTSFTFQVRDNGGTSNGGIDLDPSANTFTFTLTADSADLGSGANNNTYTVALNAGNVSILDADGSDAISATTTGTPAFTTFNFERQGNNLEYTAIKGANNTDIVVLNQYVPTNTIESMTFSNSGTFQGFSLGSSPYILNISGVGTNNANDIVAGSSADDTLSGGNGPGTDMLFGNAGNDTLTAAADSGNHLLVGGMGNDILNGGTTVDWLIGGADNDSTVGGSGNDTYLFGLTDGSDTIIDTSGTDAIQITAAPSTLLNFERVGSDLLVNVDNTTFAVVNHFAGTNNVKTIALTANGTVYGYGLGTGTYNLSTSLSGTNGTNNVVAGTSAGEALTGGFGSGQDLLFGNGGADTLTAAGSGAHLLVGGIGNDTLNVGSGADTYAFNLNDGTDTITDLTGADVIYINANNQALNTLSFNGGANPSATALTVSYDGGVISIVNHFNGTGAAGSGYIETISFDGGDL